LWLIACLPAHGTSLLLFRRSRWPRRFLGGAAWICGARVRVEGALPRPRSLLLANHLSWLDILVLGGATGCAFVSKDNLGHPVIHWLADQNKTLYIRRDRRKAAKAQAELLARALQAGQPITVFPEGTVGPGDALLPFRSTLLQVAVEASGEVEVRPVALDYGAAAREISWHGESGVDNVLRLLGRAGTIPVTVRLLEPVGGGLDRKAIAVRARSAIAAALGFEGADAGLYGSDR
jgi:lyso-ornithine lipid O-acyltransferase